MRRDDTHHSRLAGEKSRTLLRFSGTLPGPTLMVTAGIHGNEPAGVEALRRVGRQLEQGNIPLRGDLVGLAGNLQALAQGRRFVDRDLNRAWLPERVSAIRAGESAAPPSTEDREQAGLLRAVDEARAAARGDLFFLDLHTSSADGCPFLTCGDTLRNRRFALRFPVPIILGIEEQLDGSLLEYMNETGCITLGVEGGKHDLESSVDHLESVLWIALAAAGLVSPRNLPRLSQHRQRLRSATHDVHHVTEVRYRHAVLEGRDFRMDPGFENFQPVRKGQLLAREDGREIRAKETGLVLLPLYQGQGEDGFFLGRAVSRFWLRLSAVMRLTRLYRLMPLLPGVRRHPTRPATLRVNTAVARWFPLEVFHLLGYRKQRWKRNVLLVSRRRFDYVR